jgi:spore coat protein CotH
MTLLLLLACGSDLDAPTGRTDTGVLDTGGTADTADSADPNEDTAALVLDEDGDFLFGERTLDFDLALDDAALAALATDPREDVHATLAFAGQFWDVGLRLKGNASFRDMSGKASFKIDVQQWDTTARFYGMKRLTLNNMVQDPTMSAEHAAYALYGWLGIPAPRHGYARVRVNGELYGLYGIVEAVDEELLERLFPDDEDGNLYEGGYGGDFAQGCADLFSQEEGDDASLPDLEALLDEVLASTPDTFYPLLEARFDVDPLLDLWAAELVSSNADAYTVSGNNYFVYHALGADRWTMVPWGPDQSFSEIESWEGATPGRLYTRCLASTACTEALRGRVDRVLEVWEAQDMLAYVTEETARIEQDCRQDPRSPFGDYGCRDAQAALRDWVEARPDEVRTELGSR